MIFGELYFRQLLNNVKFNLRYAPIDNSQHFGGGTRNVDNTAGNERTTVIDPNRHGLPRGDVCDAHPRAEWQCTVRGGQFARIELFAARGLCSLPVKAGKSIRCILGLGCRFVGRQWGTFLRDDCHMPVRDK